MRHKPVRAKPTDVTEWNGGMVQRRADDLVTEEPLEIRVNGAPLTVTMRTPGDDFELAAGLLYTEGVISGPEDLESVAYAADSANVVRVALRGEKSEKDRRGGKGDRGGTELTPRFMSSACGICGKTSIEAIRARGLSRLDSDAAVDPAVLIALPDKLRQAQTVFERTGALHAAALFDTDGNLLLVREDVGRHNAVDKIVGATLLASASVPTSIRLDASVLLVSGRAGFEIVQKAVAGGIPIMASVSAPSSLAVQCARELGLTLVGFLRGDRFVIYAGDTRLNLRGR
jgi:FdhD protein